MSDRTLFRLGSVAAVAGAVLALVTNAIHPRPSDYGDHVTAELRMVAGSDGWILIHLGLLAGVLLIGFGLFAVARSVKDGPAEGAARVAIGVLLVSIPVAVVQLAVDGYATKAAADAWSRTTGAEQATLVAAGTAVAEVGWAGGWTVGHVLRPVHRDLGPGHPVGPGHRHRPVAPGGPARTRAPGRRRDARVGGRLRLRPAV
jgi:hypothetical protein